MSCLASNLPAGKHLFFDRHGGISGGKYASLNTNPCSLDNPENIRQNLQIAARHFNQPLTNLCILTQGVSNHAVCINEASQYQITADGMATNKANIILAIRTADCAPILFYDPQNQIIGAAHAGWRGALRGIIENTVTQMLRLGAQKKFIAAAIGPCLQKKSFICQQDMRQEFLSQDPAYELFFTPQDNQHWLFDMQEFCIHRLQNCGITDIFASNIDTYTNRDYFSYRRNCHQNLISAPRDYPTHLSTIML